MHKTKTLPNGLTLITVNLPHLDSVTTLVAVGAGSRYETKQVNGISHFLEHMFFKGSRKYPSAQIISTLIDGIGAVNNAGTSKEFTFYWIKSASSHLDLSSDILSSMIKEPLLDKKEVEKEKGVITEEIRMCQDMPRHYIFDLYEKLQFGDQPLGRMLIGEEETINIFKREHFMKYMNSLYSPKNMALIYVGKLPKEIEKIANQYFTDLPKRDKLSCQPYQKSQQDRPRVNIHFKKSDQAHIVLGVEGYSRSDKKRYIARLLGMILGEGASSRLFLQIRDKHGLAYSVLAYHESYMDTGSLGIYAGLKLNKIDEGLQVIKEELEKIATKRVSQDELKKVKEMERGRVALRSESTNFLAEHFGLNFVIDRKIETFDEYLKQIDQVGADDIRMVARDIFKPENFNLQIIGPFKDPAKFEKLLR